jgi:hypothetical protein
MRDSLATSADVGASVRDQAIAGAAAGSVGEAIANILVDTGTTLGPIKKNRALAKFAFLMTDSVNHAPAPGVVVTCTRSIDGAAFAAGTLANVGEQVSAVGMYLVDFGAGDLNGNVIVLRATAPGCDDTFITLVTQT